MESRRATLFPDPLHYDPAYGVGRIERAAGDTFDNALNYKEKEMIKSLVLGIL